MDRKINRKNIEKYLISLTFIYLYLYFYKVQTIFFLTGKSNILLNYSLNSAMFGMQLKPSTSKGEGNTGYRLTRNFLVNSPTS